MSTQDQVNAAAYQYILYYMNVTHADPELYPVDLTGVCTVGYTEDSPPQVVVTDWAIGAYMAPTNGDLLATAAGTVLPWFNNWYTVPKAISDWQSYQISTADLANVRADASMIGFQVYDTTLKVQRIWNGTSWVVMSTSTSSVSSAWSSDNVSSTFTANTPKLINVTGFTQSLNTGSEWTVDTTTGRHTYNGGIARPFRVTINYSNSKLAPLLTQEFTVFISKNGSTTINGKRTTETFSVTTILDREGHCISACVSMAPGDYIQLAGQYTATSSISIRDVSYDINGC